MLRASLLLVACFVAVTALLGRPASAEPSCTVDRVIDGDTFVCTDGTHIRMLQINAQELSDCGGEWAKAALAQHLPAGRHARPARLRPRHDGQVRPRPRGADRHRQRTAPTTTSRSSWSTSASRRRPTTATTRSTSTGRTRRRRGRRRRNGTCGRRAVRTTAARTAAVVAGTARSATPTSVAAATATRRTRTSASRRLRLISTAGTSRTGTSGAAAGPASLRHRPRRDRVRELSRTRIEIDGLPCRKAFKKCGSLRRLLSPRRGALTLRTMTRR